ncbi:hypothetical protein C0J52_27165 [Blattella germanica]|nr:hypothetical protein C0J52_27165 [Blattella germanica]
MFIPYIEEGAANDLLLLLLLLLMSDKKQIKQIVPYHSFALLFKKVDALIVCPLLWHAITVTFEEPIVLAVLYTAL